jgi:hypothetical protein
MSDGGPKISRPRQVWICSSPDQSAEQLTNPFHNEDHESGFISQYERWLKSNKTKSEQEQEDKFDNFRRERDDAAILERNLRRISIERFKGKHTSLPPPPPLGAFLILTCFYSVVLLCSQILSCKRVESSTGRNAH